MQMKYVIYIGRYWNIWCVYNRLALRKHVVYHRCCLISFSVSTRFGPSHRQPYLRWSVQMTNLNDRMMWSYHSTTHR